MYLASGIHHTRMCFHVFALYNIGLDNDNNVTLVSFFSVIDNFLWICTSYIWGIIVFIEICIYLFYWWCLIKVGKYYKTFQTSTYYQVIAAININPLYLSINHFLEKVSFYSVNFDEEIKTFTNFLPHCNVFI